VQQAGWAGLKNGVLLRQASEEFDVLLTGDQNLAFQQNPSRLPISVVVLIATNNRIETFLPLIPELLQALAQIKPGQLVNVGG